MINNKKCTSLNSFIDKCVEFRKKKLYKISMFVVNFTIIENE